MVIKIESLLVWRFNSHERTTTILSFRAYIKLFNLYTIFEWWLIFSKWYLKGWVLICYSIKLVIFVGVFLTYVDNLSVAEIEYLFYFWLFALCIYTICSWNYESILIIRMIWYWGKENDMLILKVLKRIFIARLHFNSK